MKNAGAVSAPAFGLSGKNLESDSAESDSLSYELVLFLCDLVCIVTACIEDVVDDAAAHYFIVLILERNDLFDNCVSNCLLEVAVSAAFKLRNCIFDSAACEYGIDSKKVGYTGLLVFVELDDAVRVCNCRHDLLSDRLFGIREEDRCLRVICRLAHLLCRCLKVTDLSTDRRDERLRDLKEFAVAVVESDSKVSCELNVLLLVDTCRNVLRIVEKDISSHKVRICYEAFCESFVKC